MESQPIFQFYVLLLRLQTKIWCRLCSYIVKLEHSSTNDIISLEERLRWQVQIKNLNSKEN